MHNTFYNKYVKRGLDIVIALTALVVLSPVFLVVTLLLWIHFRGNPFFLQRRPGYKGKIFTIYKFRTMTNTCDKDGTLRDDSERLTGLGCRIRKTSLDELPQLLNVLTGSMSLVGPRPLLERYLPLYTPEQMRRHDVRPGITGWAQCHGRNAISWQTKFEMDVWYVDHISFMTDLRIVLTTFRCFFRTKDVHGENMSTMELFNDYN